MEIKISRLMPNGNVWISINGIDLIQIIECDVNNPAISIANKIIDSLNATTKG